MIPPAIPIKILKDSADKFIGVPYIVVPVLPLQLQPSPGRIIHAIKKPQKPTIISINPVAVKGMLCPERSLAVPSALNLPILGPRLISTPNAKKPATA